MGPLALRAAVSAGLLAALFWLLDGAALAARLTGLRAGWALVALGISVALMALSALRWRITAARLGIELPFRAALSEYYLAVFLNQVLPGGVVGDVSRAVRHGRTGAGVAPAARAVVLERASGQLVMLAAAALSLLALPVAVGAPSGLALAAVAAAVLVALVAGLWLRGRFGPLRALGRDARAALLARGAIGPQLLTSSLVVASFVALFLAAARAVGVTTPIATLAPLVCPVLVSMLIPATIAGWGIREATAAALWSAVGLTPEDGVAISAAYGVLTLLSSLPGALVLLSAGRGRTADRPPAGSDDTGAGAPGRGSRSPGG